MPAKAAASGTGGGVGTGRPPSTSSAVLLCVCAAAAIALTAWLALLPAAQTLQRELVLWFNRPPQPVSAVLAAVNPLLRPVPLAVVSVALVGWVLVRARGPWRRLEAVRSLVLSVVLAELIAQGLKRLVDQPRPPSFIPGLDDHGYPTDPRGMAYPSAHTAVAVAVVSALWPWMSRPQRIVGTAFAVVIAANRLYIAAHGVVDVLGGAAIGLLVGGVTWLVAARWPIGGTDDD